jgi:tetratricopeptide (TPR) repeat protein
MHHQRLAFVILLCLVTSIFPGCSKRKAVSVVPKSSIGTTPYQSGNPSDLSEYIRTVLKISQENTAATQEALKQLYERRPEIAALAQVIARKANDIESRHLLAAAYLQEKLYLPAFQLYQEIKAVAPEDSDAELAVARIWNEWGDVALARQHAENAVKLNPDSAAGLDLLGRIHLRENDLDLAISAFLSAIELEPNNAMLHANAGYAYFARGDLNPARAYLQKAVWIDDSMIEAQNNLGIVLGNLGDFAGALRAFRAANKDAEAFNNLGVVYLGQRRWREARDAFRQALALSPDYAKARNNLKEAEARIPRPTVIELPSFSTDDTKIAGGQDKTLAAAGRRSSEKEQNGIQITAGSGMFIRNSFPTAGESKKTRIAAAYKDALLKFNGRRYAEAVDIFQWLLQQRIDQMTSSNCEYWIGESYYGLGHLDKAKAAFNRVLASNSLTKKDDAQKMLKRILQKSRQESSSRAKKAV